VGELKNRPVHGAPRPHRPAQPQGRPAPMANQPRETGGPETAIPEESEPKFPFDR
jgi:hypothetical protein